MLSAEVQATVPRSQPEDLRQPRQILTPLRVAFGAIAASVVFLLAYRVGAHGNQQGSFALFFLGVILGLGPVAGCIPRVSTAAARVGVLVAAGVLSYLPHFLKAPTRPFMHDEFGHNFAALNLIATGHLFAPNSIVNQTRNYPGFETMVYGLHQLTGAAPYTIGVGLILVLHVVTVLNVYVFARCVLEARVALIAGLVYSLSPQFIFVDTLFAYESLGLPLVVGAITSAALSFEARTSKTRYALTGIALSMTMVNVIVHHLSSFVGIFDLLVFALAWGFLRQRARSKEALPLLIGSVVLAGLAVLWNLIRHANINYYLTIYVYNGVRALEHRVFGGQTRVTNAQGTVTATSRTPLQASHYPWYETTATLLTQVILVLCVIASIWVFRRRSHPVWILSLVLGILYYVSLPLVFTSGGNAAHRSWAFTFVGMSVLFAAGLPILISRLQRFGTHSLGRFSARVTSPLYGTLLCIIAIGSYGAGVNYIELLPGPYQVATDGRSTPSELYQIANWLRHQPTISKPVLADSRSSDLLTGMSLVRQNKRLASDEIISGSFTLRLKTLAQQGASYVVINKYLVKQSPLEGYYFYSGEPGFAPLDPVMLKKFSTQGWLSLAYQTPNFLVYKVIS